MTAHLSGAHREGIAVLGAPRSGTTLLRRLLDAHPQVACPPETALLGAAARFLREEPFGDDLSLGVIPGLAYSGVADDVVLDRVRELTFSFLRDLAAEQGKPIWAEKTAFNGFHVEAIERLCGDHVAYLVILRHGLDVVVSLHDLVERIGVFPEELHPYIARTPRPLEAFAHAWADVTTDLLALAERRDDVVVVRYEELVAQPGAALGAALEGLGLSTDVDALLATAFASDVPGMGDWKTYQSSRVHTDAVGRWSQLAPGLLRGVAEVANPVLVAAGYEAVRVRKPPRAASARRRLQLQLLGARMASGRPQDGSSEV